MTKKKHPLITHAELLNLMTYYPETGLWTRNHDSLGGRWKAGQLCGCREKNGYMTFRIEGQNYRGHRLAWFYMTGEWPVEVDHKNTTGKWRAYVKDRMLGYFDNKEMAISARERSARLIFGEFAGENRNQ